MSCPVQHEIPVSAMLPILKRYIDLRQTRLQFHDNYPEVYQRFGIDRSEMMIVMPSVMSVDVLAGCDKLKYIGEDDRK